MMKQWVNCGIGVLGVVASVISACVDSGQMKAPSDREMAVRDGQPSSDSRVGALYSFTPMVETVGEPAATRCYLRSVYLATASLVNENVVITVMHNQSYGGEGLYFTTQSPAIVGTDETRVVAPEARIIDRVDHRRPTEFGEEDGISLAKLSSPYALTNPPLLDCSDSWDEGDIGRIVGYGRSRDGGGIGTRRFGAQPFLDHTSHGNVRFRRGQTGAIGCYGDSGSGRWRGNGDPGTVLSAIAYLGDFTCGTELDENVDFPIAPLCGTLREEADGWRQPLSCAHCPSPLPAHIYTREGCGGAADLGPAKFAYYQESSAECDLVPDYSGLDASGRWIVAGDGSSGWNLNDLCARNGLSGRPLMLCEYDPSTDSYLSTPIDCPCDR